MHSNYLGHKGRHSAEGTAKPTFQRPKQDHHPVSLLHVERRLSREYDAARYEVCRKSPNWEPAEPTR